MEDRPLEMPPKHRKTFSIVTNDVNQLLIVQYAENDSWRLRWMEFSSGDASAGLVGSPWFTRRMHGGRVLETKIETLDEAMALFKLYKTMGIGANYER